MTLTSPPAMSSSLHGATAWERYTIPGMLPMVVAQRRSLSACASSASCRPVTSISRPIISAGCPSSPGTKTARSSTQRVSPDGGEDPVLGLGAGRTGVDVAVQLADDPLEVVGVHDVRPGAVPIDEVRRVVAEQAAEALAEERRVPRLVEVAAIGGAGQAAHEAAEHLLALAQRVLGLAQLGDVADEAFEVEEIAVVVVDADAALPHPAGLARRW